MTETPTIELSRPTDDIILYCAMKRPWAGSIWMSSKASTKVLRPRNLKRLIATAPRKAKIRQKKTTMRVIETLMPSAPKNEPSEIAPAKLEAVKSSPGKKCGVNCCSTAFEMNAEFTIQ